MNSSTIIIADSIESASWASRYKSEKSSEQVKILALTFEAQSFLHSKSVFPFDYFDVSQFPEKLFTGYNKISQKETLSYKTYLLLEELIKISKQHNISYNGYNILSILRLHLFPHLIELLRAHLVIQNIVKKWKPAKYFLPATHHSPLKEYLSLHPNEKNKIHYFYCRKQNGVIKRMESHITLAGRNIFNLPKIVVIAGFKLKYGLIQFLSSAPKPIIIFYSLGSNLSFYNRFFLLINKLKRDTYYIVSGKQSLQYLLLLNNQTLHFHQYDRILPKLSESSFYSRLIHRKILALKDKLWIDTAKDLKEILFGKIVEVLTRQLDTTIHNLKSADHLFKTTQPKLLITTSDPGPQALTFVYPAKKRGVETIMLLHGLYTNVEKSNHESSHIAVWGPRTKEWFVRNHKKDPKTVYDIGFPLLDDFLLEKKAFWQRSNPPPHIKKPTTIGLLLSPYTHLWPDPYIARFLTEVFSQYQENPSYKFTVRTHPYHSLNNIHTINNIYAISLECNPYENMEKFIEKTDIVLCLGTSTIIWPLLYGKPLIHVRESWGPGLYPTNDYNAAWSCKNAKALYILTDKIRSDYTFAYSRRSGQKAILESLVGQLDGKSSERLVEIIHKIIKNKED